MRFTIRDVLWLTVVVAFALGWVLEYKNRGPEYARLGKEIARLNEQNKLAAAEAQGKYEKLVKIHNAEVQSHRNSMKLFDDTNRMLEDEAKASRAFAESVWKKFGYGAKPSATLAPKASSGTSDQKASPDEN